MWAPPHVTTNVSHLWAGADNAKKIGWDARKSVEGWHALISVVESQTLKMFGPALTVQSKTWDRHTAFWIGLVHVPLPASGVNKITTPAVGWSFHLQKTY